MLQLLAGAEPDDLGRGQVQLKSAGCRPLVDVMDADSEAVNHFMQCNCI